nr:NAD(P)/FAD-dependent oxidoreductase [Clostridia bacterium]
MAKRIVILGAGYAGVLTAKKLAKRLKKRDDITVTLIDKNSYHTMLTELHEVAAGRVDESSVRIPLEKIFAGRRVELVTDRILSVDYAARQVKGANGTYGYDYLVLATGSQPACFGIPGVEEYTRKLWSYMDAVHLKEHILGCFRRAASETDPETRKRLLTFFVAGAGFTGAEMAGELAEWAPILCHDFRIPRSEVDIVAFDLLDRVVPTFPPKLSAKAQRRLEKMGVRIWLKTSLTGVGKQSVELKRDGQVVRYPTETVIWTAGIECADVAKDSKELPQVGRARIQTDGFLRAEGREEVFVVGDSMFYVPEGEDLPVPQMVENCEQSAEIAAHNIGATATGECDLRTYRPRFHGAMLCIGGRYGIAWVGTAKKKLSLASFFAMFVKHFINIVYFLQVLGWNKVAGYLKHEFFTIRNKRSFVGGHLSNRSPSFLLVPLRLFLGFYWVYEGAKKIAEGWLSEPHLTGFFQGAQKFYDGIIAGTGGADAAAGASAPAAAAGKVLLHWNILGLFKLLLVSSSDVAVRFSFVLTDWFTNSVIIPNDGLQMVFQFIIVLSEILIGAALFGGLFTTIAAGYSLVLQVLFVMTTGLYMGTWWMVVAAVAVLFGGGRSFAL